MKAWWWLAILVLAACAQKPTKVHERNTNAILPAKASADAITIMQTTRVIDVRTPFAYATGHIQGALSLQWSDFSEANTKFKGRIDRDTGSVARRLARLGIAPDTDLVIVGLGVKGSGEEGRLAWMLTYLGLQRVRVASLDYFVARLTTRENPPVANAATWDADLQTSLLVERDELTAAAKPPLGKSVTEDSRTKEGERSVIIDVRSEREYLGIEGFGQQFKVPDMNAINIEWTQFYNSEGRPNREIIAQLQAVGITPHQRIIVVDSEGVRSGAVTWALYQLGFKNAGSYPGGLEEYWSGRVKKK